MMTTPTNATNHAMANKPHWAQAVIVAVHRQDKSDLQTDLHSSSRTRMVALCWVKSLRNSFPEFREAAKLLPKLLGVSNSDEIDDWEERREEYSMGAGTYLSEAGGWHCAGWKIIKYSLSDWDVADMNSGGAFSDSEALPALPKELDGSFGTLKYCAKAITSGWTGRGECERAAVPQVPPTQEFLELQAEFEFAAENSQANSDVGLYRAMIADYRARIDQLETALGCRTDDCRAYSSKVKKLEAEIQDLYLTNKKLWKAQGAQ